MKATIALCLVGAGLLVSTSLAPAQLTGTPKGTDPHLSYKLEIQRAIDRGNKWLRENQDPETGAWGDPDQPAFTALALSALRGDPSLGENAPLSPEVVKGYEFLLTKVKTDGGIYGKGLACYNTSLSMMALLAWEDERTTKPLLAARRFLINQQSDFDARGEADNVFDGGIGYGGTYAHSDLSNTHLVLGALYHSKTLVADGSATELDRRMELDWDAAIEFVSRCQNLPESNKEDWVSPAPDDRGGFVYFPGSSKAGTVETADGRTALRSYGSMSYAGLLSLVYADLEEDDPRLEAVLDWLSSNYTVEANPGMNQEGLYYYYHTMAKALSILNYQEFPLADGTVVHWRKDLSKKLFDLQQPDGSWKNADGRWWENDPVLVTCYAVLSLEHILHGM